MSKVRTTFMLGPAEREVLEKLSNQTGAPVSELLRRSVATWLDQHGQLVHNQRSDGSKSLHEEGVANG